MREVVTAGDRPLGQLVELALDEAGTPHLAFYEVTRESRSRGSSPTSEAEQDALERCRHWLRPEARLG